MKPPTFKTPNQPTMPEIVALVNSIVKRTERSIRADVKRLGIEHLGKRQRPQRYPASAPWQILASLGYPVAASKLPPTDTALSALNQINWRQSSRATNKRKATR